MNGAATVRATASAAGAVVLLGAAAAGGATTVLYDGAAGADPVAQGWAYGTNPLFGASATRQSLGDRVELDTTPARTDQAGWFSNTPFTPRLPTLPTLDRAAGFAVTIRARIDVEANQGDDNNDGVGDRAGFSLIVVAEDLGAIELAFWEDRVWVYDDDASDPADLFTQAEGVSTDTTLALRDYELYFAGDAYFLRVDGSALLAGRVRDYTARVLSGFDPYEESSFVFFGDDTSRAEARAEVARVTVEDRPVCPGDADGDGDTDVADFFRLASSFGSAGPGLSPLDGDVNLDGSVDVADFFVLAGSFGCGS